MDHPNIARIHDGGATESGRPFFVMELVSGVPITEYCERQGLDIRQRLELFIHVCQAVHHAHQKGIIHRDLKPSNIMVAQYDAAPVVKIIDFGIAKATGPQLTDQTLFTNFAQMIGTPMYMSPEQAQLNGWDVDTRSDVYSLGVLLYELMTGTTPFERERLRAVPYDEMIRIIREEEPERPSARISTLGPDAKTASHLRSVAPQKWSHFLRGELDWIAMKALEKDRNRRYESAISLADDVQRYRADEPVQACPPSVGYRLRKSVRRNKLLMATMATVFAALAAGTAVAVWQAVIATRAKQTALDAAAAEKVAKLAAEAKEAEAQAVVAFLEERVIAAAQPEGVGSGLGHDVSLRRAIEAAVPFVEGGFKTQPMIEARLRMVLGQSFASLGESKKSRKQFATARHMYAALLGPDHESTINAALCVASADSADGRFAESRKLCTEMLTHARAVHGSENWVTLKAMDHLAISCDGMGLHQEALDAREEAVRIRKETLGPENRDTLQSLMELAVSFSHFDRNAEALAIEEKVLAARRARHGPDHVETLQIMNNAAFSKLLLGQVEDARAMNEFVLARRKEKLGIDHPLTLQSMSNLAVCHGSLGQWPQSLELHKQALELSKTKLGRDHTATLERMGEVANCHRRLGQGKQAMQLCEEALRLYRAKPGPPHRSMMQCMHNLAMCYQAEGQSEKALELGTESLKLRSDALGADHPDTLWTMNNLGIYHSDAGKHVEALAWHRKTLAGRTARLGDAHRDTFTSLVGVARCLIRLDCGPEAVRVIDDGIERTRRTDGRQAQAVDLLTLRMEYFRKMKDVEGCRATAVLWDGLGRVDADGCYNSACAHAQVSAAIRDRDSSSAEATTQANREANLAMEWLRKSIAAGYRNAAHMAQDSDLDILRPRPDFRKLLAELNPSPKTGDK
jgi:tetratricopeptide (TPR) repeat protein